MGNGKLHWTPVDSGPERILVVSARPSFALYMSFVFFLFFFCFHLSNPPFSLNPIIELDLKKRTASDNRNRCWVFGVDCLQDTQGTGPGRQDLERMDYEPLFIQSIDLLFGSSTVRVPTRAWCLPGTLWTLWARDRMRDVGPPLFIFIL